MEIFSPASLPVTSLFSNILLIAKAAKTGLRTAPSHGPDGWETVRAALCWFEGAVAGFKEPLAGGPDETRSRKSERPPSNADKVIERDGASSSRYSPPQL